MTQNLGNLFIDGESIIEDENHTHIITNGQKNNSQLSINIGAEGTYDTSHAYVPTVIKESDTSYKMWYSGFNGTNNRIIYVTSTDGITWSNHQLSINIGAEGTYDVTRSAYPFVIKESDTSYKMWYSGYDETNYRILYATSTDGITWSNHQLSINIGAQGTYDTVHSYIPFVIKESDTSYKMWYTGHDGLNQRILYATSTDGVTWSNHQLSVNIGAEGTYDTVHVFQPYIIKESNTSYKMWCAGNDGTTYRIIYATSIDGISWSNFQLSVDIGAEGTYDTARSAYPSVIKESDTSYKMWYSGFDGANYRIIYTTSTNGISWTSNSVTLDTSEKKYGESSLSFNGTNSYLTVPDHEDWLLDGGVGDPFTFDCWVRFNSLTSTYPTFVGQYVDLLNTWNIAYDSSQNTLYIVSVSEPTVGSYDFLIRGAYTLSLSTWYHIAVVRVDNSNSAAGWRMFVNGVSIPLTLSVGEWDGTMSSKSASLGTSYHPYGGNSTNYYVDGNLDNIRVTKGVALWTDNFDVDDEKIMFYKAPDVNPNRPNNLSELYHRKQMILRGKAKQGFVRPTIKQFFTSMAFEEIASSAILTGYTEDLVPKLSSATPEIIYSGQIHASYPPYRAFNNSSLFQGGWICGYNFPAPWYIGYQFSTPKTIKKYTVQNRNDPAHVNAPKNFEFQGSNNGSDWDTLDIEINQNATNTSEFINEYIIDNEIPYTHYRLFITETRGPDTYGTIGELEMMEGIYE